MIIPIKAIPKASKTRLGNWHGKELKVYIASIAEKGEANEELIRFLAKLFDLPKSYIALKKGATSQHKLIEISGIDEATLHSILEKNIPASD